MFLDIENIGIDTSMLVLGAIEQEILAKLWSYGAITEINMAATMGRKFLGSIFFNDLYVLKNTCAKVHAFLTKCTILVRNLP